MYENRYVENLDYSVERVNNWVENVLSNKTWESADSCYASASEYTFLASEVINGINKLTMTSIILDTDRERVYNTAYTNPPEDGKKRTTADLEAFAKLQSADQKAELDNIRAIIKSVTATLDNAKLLYDVLYKSAQRFTASEKVASRALVE